MVKPAIDFHSLSIPDRLALVEQIWDSIAQDTQSLPLTPEQREELERRWAEHERDPASRAALLFGPKQRPNCFRRMIGMKLVSPASECSSHMRWTLQ
ncbi:MAG: addiction module protein [Gemmatimonadetes bacterium]|nr:addiction module protein [Gemmatimonadota bacterium]